METIEIRNETDKPIIVSACRSRITEKLYIHVGRAYDHINHNVEPRGYNVIKVEEVEL